MPVGPDGRFTYPVTDYEGMHVFDANAHIIDHLKARTRGEGETGRSTAGHGAAAPRDLRPLLPALLALPRAPHLHGGLVVVRRGHEDQGADARAQPGDRVDARAHQGRPVRQVAGQRPRLVDLAKPLLGQPDPRVEVRRPAIPALDVYGSFEELERDFGVEVTDLHRPFIDSLTRPNPDDPTGRSTMRRVEDVLDVWFDSGSMSFAQVHYPFENAEWFEHHFPGDFIVEYIGQTRGWFYTLHVLATALFDRPAFKTCVSHGIVLGSDGQKMSKSLRNYPDVPEVFDRDGADAMRWFLMSSPILRGGNLVVTEQGIRDGVRQVMIPLWNAWSFFALYANTARGGEGYEAKRSTDSTDVLDRYLLAKLERVRRRHDATSSTTTRSPPLRHDARLPRRADQLVHPPLPRPLLGRRERGVARGLRHALDRARDGHAGHGAPAAARHRGDLARADRRALGAPDRLPRPPTDLPADHALVVAMDRARESARPARACARPRAARPPAARRPDASSCPSRRPRAASAHHPGRAQRQGLTLVDLATASEADFGITQRLTVNARAAGPRLGKDVQQAIKGSKSGDWSVSADGVVTAGGLALVEGEYALETVVAGDAADAGDGDAAGWRLRRARHDGDPGAGRRGRWPATSCGRSSRPAATPACTSATGSA